MRSYLNNWREHQESLLGRSAASVRTYVDNTKQFISWLETNGKNTIPKEITRADINEYLKSLYYKQNYVNATRSTKLSAIRSFFNFLQYEGIITNDPSKGVPSPKKVQNIPQMFTTEELSLIFSAPDLSKKVGIRDLAMLMTMYGAGLRVSEVNQLDIDSIKDSGGYIRLQIHGKGYKKRMLVLSATPSKKLREWLVVRVNIQTEIRALFISFHRKPTRLSVVSLALILKKYAKMVKIPSSEVFCHKMRSTWATDLYDSGQDHCSYCNRPINKVGIMEIRILAGWNDINTAQRYIAMSDKVINKTKIPEKRWKVLERISKEHLKN